MRSRRDPTRTATSVPPDLRWTNSYWVVILIALCIGFAALLFSLTLDRLLHGIFRHIYASDWFEAISAAVLSGVVLIRMQSRRRELLARMQIVEDVNHHVRNALTAIVFSASLREDPELNAQVRDACARIDWVLTEVLSRSVDGLPHESPTHSWNAGREI